MSSVHSALARSAIRRRQVLAPAENEFYRHYWSCPVCCQRRRCEVGQGLWESYTIMAHVAEIVALDDINARRRRLDEVQGNLRSAVQEKVKAMWAESKQKGEGANGHR